MELFNFNPRISVVQKITLAGLFIALITILQKVVAINYIAVIPFLRVSFGGCALLIFSSFLLGPWYGLLIGAASDVLGYFIFDPKTMGFFPQITLIYALLGFSAYFAFKLVKLVKSKKAMIITESSFFAVIFTAVTLYICLNNDITLYSSTYHIELWQKITIPLVLFALFIVLVIVTILTDRFFKKRHPDMAYNTYQISFACALLELFVMIIFGTIMKGWAFGFQTYLAILMCQVIVAFINIPLNTFIVSYVMLYTRKYWIC